jgi:hypothetical protein
MNETKNKGGRPKKDPIRLLSETLQVKVTKKEWDLLDEYCQANGIERADYLRKSIFSRINTWWAKNQPVHDPAPVVASSTHAETPEQPADPPMPVASPIIVAEKAPELPVKPQNEENQAPAPPKPKKAPKPPKSLPFTHFKPRSPEELTAEYAAGLKELGLDQS